MRSEILSKVAALEKGFTAAFVRDGKLHGTLEEGMKNDIDGALLAIINFGVVKDPALVRDTVDRMELLKVASGGYKRVRSNYTDPAIFEYWYEKEEFLFVDFSLAEVYRRMGRNAEADAMLKRIVDKAAADHNIIPEMYVAVPCALFPGAIGDPLERCLLSDTALENSSFTFWSANRCRTIIDFASSQEPPPAIHNILLSA